MASRTDWRLYLPRGIRTLPFDLAAVLVFVAAVNLAVFMPVVNETPVRIALGLPFVLFVPGYAFIAALFPERGEGPGSDEDASREDGTTTSPADDEETDDNDHFVLPSSRYNTEGGIDGIERVALSFGLSIAIVPLMGLGLNFTPFGIRLAPIMASVSLFTVTATAVAATRRRALPEGERFRVPYRQWTASARSELFEPEDRTDAALNVLLVVSVVLAAASVGYAVAVPKQGEQFSEFYLLTETDDGDLVADDYPTNLTVGESESLIVGVSNNEHSTVEYTVVTELQNVTVSNNSTQLHRAVELNRFQQTLAHNETWTNDHTVTPAFAGERLRLAYLLYRGDPPEDPSMESAYRSVHLWVNVTER